MRARDRVKQVVSTFMSVVLVVGLSPTSAYAASADTSLQASPIVAQSQDDLDTDLLAAASSTEALSSKAFETVRWPFALSSDGGLYDFSGSSGAVMIADGVRQFEPASDTSCWVLKSDSSVWVCSSQSASRYVMGNVSKLYGGAAVTGDGSLYLLGDSPVKASIPGAVIDYTATTIYYDSVAHAAINANGDLYTWGTSDNVGGSSLVETLGRGENDTTDLGTPKKILGNVRQVRLYIGKGFAIGEDGSLWTWGFASAALGTGNSDDAVYSPYRVFNSGVTTAAMFNQSGAGHVSMALKQDGSLYGWGSDSALNLSASPTLLMTNVKSIDAANAVIKTDGSLYMWGSNSFGQLGKQGNQTATSPIKVLDGVASVQTGTDDRGGGVAIKTDGTLWMWGSSTWMTMANVAHQVNDPRQICSHVSEVYVTNALLKDGSSTWMLTKTDSGALMAWGGVPSNLRSSSYDSRFVNLDVASPVEVLGNVVDVSLGVDHGAAVTSDGSLFTWGGNAYGELGNGTDVPSAVPTKIMDGVSKVSLGGGADSVNGLGSTSNGFGAAVKTDGTLWMWGSCEGGRLGSAQSENWLVPHMVMEGVEDVELGGSEVLVIKKNKELWMWRAAEDDGSSYALSCKPRKVMDGVRKAAVFDGVYAAIKTDGSLWTWGDNYYNQIGNGVAYSRSDDATRYFDEPVCVLDSVSDVCFSKNRTLALSSNGDVFLWGGASSTRPVEIMGGVKAISAGNEAYGVVKQDGSLWLWGVEYYPGSLAGCDCGSTGEQAARVDGVENAASVTFNKSTTYGVFGSMLDQDGSLYLWGQNNYGQLGRGWASFVQSPPLTIGGVDATSISTCDIVLEYRSCVYDGKAHLPAVTVSHEGRNLGFGTDYKVDYADYINAGTATVTVTGIGDYFGSVARVFTIEKADPTLTFASATLTKSLVSTPFSNLFVKKTDGVVTFVSTNTSVATVNSSTGQVSPKKVGTTTIIASAKEGANYKAGSASYSLTITKYAELQDLAYSFGNHWDYFGYPRGYKIPLSSYEIVFESTQAKFLYSISSAWGGSCFGMASTAMMFNSQSSGLTVKDFNSSASMVKDLKVNDVKRDTSRNLTSYIEAMQVSQRAPAIQSTRSSTRNDLDGLVAAVEKASETGELVSIGVYGLDEEGESSGHALVGYKVVPVGSYSKRLYVYDCNFRGNERYITLSTNSAGRCTGWYYHLNDKYDWGSAYSGSYINYTPYHVIESVWLDGGGTHAVNTLNVNSSDFSVFDSSDAEVARVEDGELVKSDENVYRYISESMNTDSGTEEDPLLLYLPSDDAYRVVNNDKSLGEFKAAMVNVEQSSSVSTSARSVIFATNDDEEINLIDVDAAAGETYSIQLESSLESAQGQEHIELSGIGNGTSLSMGMASGNCVIVNGKSASLYVNGQQVDTGDRADVADLDVSLEYDSCIYDGAEHRPQVLVRSGSTELVPGDDYVVMYARNTEPGTAAVTVYGVGAYDGKVQREFEIVPPKGVSQLEVTVGQAAYTGGELRPPVTVKDGSRELSLGGDYTVEYRNNVNAGQGIAVVTGKGAYEGSVERTFGIAPAALTSVTLERASAAFDGADHRPSVKAVSAGALVVPQGGYAVSFLRGGTPTGDFKSPGVITVRVAGRGNFAGLATASFAITGGSSVQEAEQGAGSFAAGRDASGTGDGGSAQVGSASAKAANPMKVKASTKTVKAKKLKKKAQSVKAIKVTGAAGKVSFKNVSKKKALKKFKVAAKTGKVTVPKKTKKGTYKVKVRVSAAGDAVHLPTSKTVTAKIKIK